MSVSKPDAGLEAGGRNSWDSVRSTGESQVQETLSQKDKMECYMCVHTGINTCMHTSPHVCAHTYSFLLNTESQVFYKLRLLKPRMGAREMSLGFLGI